MWLIIKNEFLSLFRSRVFFGLSIFIYAIIYLSVHLGNYKTEKQNEVIQGATDHVRQQWMQMDDMDAHAAAHYGTYVFKPANILSSLDEGVNSVTGSVLRVEGHVQNEIVHSEASQMLSVSRFGILKSSLMLQYILPLFLIFLSFNALSREKSSGRLKLLILQGASPRLLIFSKLLSVWLYAILILLVIIIIYALLNFQNFTPDILMRVLLFFIVYGLYYFIIIGLTIYFSAQWQNSTLALTFMIAIWILWTIFFPHLIMSSMEKMYPLPSRGDFQSAMKEDRSKGIDGHNPKDKRTEELKQKVLKEHNVATIDELPFNFNGLRMQADEEHGNKVWDKHFGSNNAILNKQKQAAQLAGIIDPFQSLKNASMGLMATDNIHHQDFLLQVEKYRRLFIKMLNDRYTIGAGEVDNEFFKSVPEFQFKPMFISNVYGRYLLDFIPIIFWSLLTFFLVQRVSKTMRIV